MNEATSPFLKNLITVEFRRIISRIYRQIYYFGRRYECPFCRSHLRKFLPHGAESPILNDKQVVGGGYRPNARCPVCRSLDRERLIYLFLLNKTNILEIPQRVLHVAPESNLSDILQNQSSLQYVSADLCSEEVMVRMDITNIPFPDHWFTNIVCNHVLEHVVDDRKAMLELYRVLAMGGWAILQVPMSLSLQHTYEDSAISIDVDREKAFGQLDHVRIYAKDYKDRLEQAGFKVSVFHWTDEPGSFGGDTNRFGLNEEEPVYLASKSPSA